jgi:hypothetical protein
MLLARSMTTRKSKLGVLVVCASLFAVLVPQVAWGQTCPAISINVNSVVPRYTGARDTSGNLLPLRPQNLQPTWIDENDCKSDARLQFTVLIGGLPCTDTIQVWAGTTDCTQVSARQANSGSTGCWPVAASGSFAMSSSATGDIRAQDIVAFINSAEPPTIYAPSSVEACQALVDDAKLTQCGMPLSLYFMAIEADGETVDGTSAIYDLGAELVLADGGSCSSSSTDAGPLKVNVVDAGAGGSSTAGSSGSAGSDGEGSGGTIIHGCSVAPGRRSGPRSPSAWLLACVAALAVWRRSRR